MPSTDGYDQAPDHVDAEFARIVAGYDTAPDWPEEPIPGRPDDPAQPALPGPIWPAKGPVLNRPEEEPSLLDGLDTFGANLPDDTPEEFVPPPPPPLPFIHPAAILSVLGIIAGFVFLLSRQLLPGLSEGLHTVLGLGGIVGGALGLIMRLHPGGADDEPPADGGAVV